MIYYIYFAIVLLYAIFGAYVYVYRKEKINIKEVMNLFWISLILRSFDFLSTVFFTTRLGIDYEGNLIARVFMYMFGIWGGLFVSLAFFIPLTFFLFVAVNFSTKDLGWKIFKITIILIGIFVPIINLSSAI
jgi:hypothetical protein